MLTRISEAHIQIKTNERWSNWHKYTSLATFIHNTSYNSSIACCPSAVFHRQEPITPLDLRFPVKSLETATANSNFVSALQDAMFLQFKETKGKLMASYQSYRKYYKQKASA